MCSNYFLKIGFPNKYVIFRVNIIQLKVILTELFNEMVQWKTKVQKNIIVAVGYKKIVVWSTGVRVN